MQPVSTYYNNGLWSAATMVAILCHNVPREQAALAIGSAIDNATLADIDTWLDNPSSPAEFRAVWASATANTLTFLDEQIAALPTSEVTNKLADQLATVGGSLDEMRKEIRRSEIRNYLRDLEAEAESRIRNIIDEDSWTYKRAHDLIWNHVGFGEAIAEWRKILEELE